MSRRQGAILIVALAFLVAVSVGIASLRRQPDIPADDRADAVTIVPGPPGAPRVAEPPRIDEPPTAAPDADRPQADPSVESQLQRDIQDDIVGSRQRAQERERSTPPR